MESNKVEKPSAEADKEFLDAYCRAWAKWSHTRRYYIKAPPLNLLGRMQPYKQREAPDAMNYPDMQHFNHAVHTLVDMNAGKDAFSAANEEFHAFYVYYVMRVRTKDAIRLLEKKDASGKVIEELTPSTYYRRIERFRQRAYSMSLSLKRVTESAAAHRELMEKISQREVSIHV